MTENNNVASVDLVSAGVILGGLSRAQVIKRIKNRFSVSEAQALSMLKKGKLIKKSVPNHSSNKIIKVFASSGLKVLAFPVKETGKQENITASNDPAPRVKEDKIEPTDSILTSSLTRSKDRLLYASSFFQVLSVILVIGTIVGVWLLGIVSNIFLINYLINFSFFTGLFSTLFILLLFAQFGLTILSLIILFGKYPERQGYILPREDAEGAYKLVESVCDKLNLVYPNHIQVDNEVDVQVVSSGSLSDFYAGRYALSLSLPIAACFNMKDVTGMAAFALSVLNNKYLMRINVFIVSLKAAIELRVYQRNAFDLMLREVNKSTYSWWVVLGFQLLEYTNRKIRFLLKHFGLVADYLLNHSVQSLRQRALAYEIFIVGEQSYRKNSINLVKVLETREVVDHINQNAWLQGRLFRNKAAAVELIFSTKEKVDRLENQNNFELEKTYRVSQHPLRYENVKLKKATQGFHPKMEAFLSSDSAKTLFLDFYELCEQVTLDGYIESYVEGSGCAARKPNYYGLTPEKWMVAEDVIFKLNQAMQENTIELNNFLGFGYENRIMMLDEPQNPDLVKMGLQAINDWIRERLIGYREDNRAYAKLQEDSLLTNLSQALLAHRIKVKAANLLEMSTFNLRKRDENDTNARLEKSFQPSSSEIDESLEMISSRLNMIDRMYYQRIVHCIQLMDEDNKFHAQHLITSLQDIEELSYQSRRLRESAHILNCIPSIKPKTLTRRTMPITREHEKICAEAVSKLYKRAQEITVYDELGEERTMSELIAAIPGVLNIKTAQLASNDYIEIADDVLFVIAFYYSNMLSQLARLCGEAEIINGIRPLKVIARTSPKPSLASSF